MFEVLLVVIGVLVLTGLLVMGRSRRGSSDPSTSVDAFHRALSAMEPGGRDNQRRRAVAPEDEGADEAADAPDDAPIDLTRQSATPQRPAEQDGPGR